MLFKTNIKTFYKFFTDFIRDQEKFFKAKTENCNY